MTHGSAFVLRIAFGGRPPPPAESQLAAARRCPLPAPRGRRPGCGVGKTEPALPGTARPLDRPDPQPRALAAPGDRDAPPEPLRQLPASGGLWPADPQGPPLPGTRKSLPGATNASIPRAVLGTRGHLLRSQGDRRRARGRLLPEDAPRAPT